MLTLFSHKNRIAESRRTVTPASFAFRRSLFALIWLSNEKAGETSLTSNGIELANSATEEKPVPEWIEIPLGNHDHRVARQVFDREAGEEMLANFKSLGPRSKGIPIYLGHPDVDAKRWPDKSAKGWIKEMKLSNDALRLRIKWNKAGHDLVANEEFAYFSPTWGCVPIKGRTGALRPIRLRSVGLVNEPNIGVMPLTNETQTEGPTMPPWLLELLGLTSEATEEEVRAALAAKLTGLATATTSNETYLGAIGALGDILINALPENDESQDRADFLTWMHDLLGTDPATGVEGLKSALQDKVSKSALVDRVKSARKAITAAHDAHNAAYQTLETAMSNEVTARTTAETELANARTAFNTERKMRSELIVSNLIASGKLRKADAEAKITELSNAGEGFDALVTTLSNAAPVLPTTGALTKDLANRKGTTQESATVLDLVNERMTEKNEDYRTAFNHVKKDNPELFAAMKQPATATK